MKRMTLLTVALSVAVLIASNVTLCEAQVIGTYRPSLVTYYPSATSVTPVAYYKPVPATTQYAANYSSYPVASTSYTQPISTAPVVQSSYVGATPYVANYPYTTAGSPVVGGACGCAPIQTIGTTSCYPTTAYAPVQTVAYQQPVAPVQPITAQPGLIDGKWYVGKGLLGRPKLYAEGQPIRNAFRTILP